MFAHVQRYFASALSCGRVVLALSLCLGGATSYAQTSAGEVMSVVGSVRAVDASGKTRELAKGGAVHAGDRIITPDGTLVQLRMADGGYLSVRPGTEMVVNRFVYDEVDSSKSSFLVSLLKGGFRSITGLIGRSNPNAYQIQTSTATIGIRGTDHEPMFVPVAGVGRSGNLPGFYDKVNQGETFIKNDLGVLSLKAGQIGFAPITPTNAPGVLLKVPDFYKMDVKVDARPASESTSSIPPSTAAAAPVAAPTPEPAATPATPVKGLVPTLSAAPNVRTDAGSRTAVIPSLTTGSGKIEPAAGAAVLTGAPKVLSGATLIAPTLSNTTLSPTLINNTLSPTLINNTLSPTLSSTTLSPTLSSTTLSPTLINNTLSPTLSNTTLSPTLINNTLSPTLSSTTLSPTLSSTTLSPTLSSTTLSPTLSSTTLSPTLATTTTSPTLSTTTSPTLSSSTLSTTTAPKLSTTTTTIAPKLSTTTLIGK